MNNEFLRVNNQSSHGDNVNKYSANVNKKPIKQQKNKSVHAIDFIVAEFNDDGEVVSSSSTISAPKPKLLKCVYLSILLGVFAVLSVVASTFLNKIELLLTSVFLIAILVPVSFSYFIYALSTREKSSFANVVTYVLIGAIIFLVSNEVSESLISVIKSHIVFTSLRSVIEIVFIIFAIALIVANRSQKSLMSILLIATLVASGFSVTKSLTESFYELFIPFGEGAPNQIVGAIINADNFIAKSNSAFLENVVKISLFKPLVFISLVVVITEIIYSNFKNQGVKTITLIVVTLFCVVIYVLANVETHIGFLNIIYSSVTVILNALLLYRSINSAIRHENYEQ